MINMKRDDYLLLITKQIVFIYDRNTIKSEINNHIDDSIEELILEGYNLEEAEAIAIKQMGDPIQLGKELNKIHNPIIGYLYILTKYCMIILLILALLFGLKLFYN